MRKFLLTPILFFIFTTLAIASNSFCGLIKSSATEEPLTNVNVWIPERNIGAFTDQRGEFCIPLKPGFYAVEISHIGFETQQFHIQIESGDVFHEIKMVETGTIAEEVIVEATRYSGRIPTSVDVITANDISKNNTAVDLPVLLNSSPSVVYNSDAGNGIGYTSLSIRGMDQTRINVTVNGIPMNDQESHNVFWVNMPDLASSVQNIQIQRGVGTSTNGGQAFGSSINIETDYLTDKPVSTISSAFGSFNSYKVNSEYKSGKMENNWAFNTRLSKIYTDGYLDRAFADLKSYYFSGGHFTDKSILRFTAFSGKEKTYQAWYGATDAQIEQNRRFNPYTYENQTDNYQQDHFQLHYSTRLSSKLNLNLSGHYTLGRGFYEEYVNNGYMPTYGAKPLVYADSTIDSSDLVRQLWLKNHFFGVVGSLIFKAFEKEEKQLNLIFGGNANRYLGDHYGNIAWMRYASNTEPGDRYYFNSANKTNINLYGKANWLVRNKWNVLAEIQYRHVAYAFEGQSINLQPIDYDVHFDFLNPKLSIVHQLNEKVQINLYVGRSHREPLRDDYVSSVTSEWPKAESVTDIEAGFSKKIKFLKTNLTINLYHMQFQNQLVLNGALSSVGAYLRSNVGNSYRQGIELGFASKLTNSISWTGNLTFSSNRLKSTSYYVPVYEETFNNLIGNQEIQIQNKTLSFSPSVIGFSRIAMKLNPKTEIALQSKYVGKQYLDNSESDDRKLDGYFLNDLAISYSINGKKAFNNLRLGIALNNIANVKYFSKGAAYQYVFNGSKYSDNYYFAQAGTNVMFTLAIQF